MSSHVERYGFISASTEEHLSRIHMEGFQAASPIEVSVMPVKGSENETYLVFCLDPYSPLGAPMSRYAVSFSPPTDFHFSKASVHIYSIDEMTVRMEIRFTSMRRFVSGKEVHPTQEIYGIQFPLEECGWLTRTGEEAVA